MGFFDKVFGAKTAGGPSRAESEGFRVHEIPEKGFSIAVPQDWSAAESASGFESHPEPCSRVKGPGAGRESALRSLQASGLRITMIRDITPVPHNGCRPPKKRRV